MTSELFQHGGNTWRKLDAVHDGDRWIMTAERVDAVALGELTPAECRVWTQRAIDEADGPHVPGFTSPRCIVAHTVPDDWTELPTVAYLCMDGTWRVQAETRMSMTVRLPDGVELDASEFTGETVCGQPLTRPRISDERTPPPCGGHDVAGLRA